MLWYLGHILSNIVYRSKHRGDIKCLIRDEFIIPAADTYYRLLCSASDVLLNIILVHTIYSVTCTLVYVVG